MKKLIVIATVTATALPLLVAERTPASAHQGYAEHSGNYARTSQYHYAITVCDNDPDGNYAYAIVEFADGSQAEERDGGDLWCDKEEWSEPFSYFWVCEERGRPGRLDDTCSNQTPS
jgi:hypothetical protein